MANCATFLPKALLLAPTRLILLLSSCTGTNQLCSSAGSYHLEPEDIKNPTQIWPESVYTHTLSCSRSLALSFCLSLSFYLSLVGTRHCIPQSKFSQAGKWVFILSFNLDKERSMSLSSKESPVANIGIMESKTVSFHLKSIKAVVAFDLFFRVQTSVDFSAAVVCLTNLDCFSASETKLHLRSSF